MSGSVWETANSYRPYPVTEKSVTATQSSPALIDFKIGFPLTAAYCVLKLLGEATICWILPPPVASWVQLVPPSIDLKI